MFQEKNRDRNTLKKKNIYIYIYFPVKDIKIPYFFLQNPKVPMNAMGFNNHTQIVTGPNYLDVDNPFEVDLWQNLYSSNIDLKKSREKQVYT